MPLLETPSGSLEYLITGHGSPVTVYAHGLAGSIPETRPFASGVPGTGVFLHFRGHGASSAPETPWTYDALGEELRAVVSTSSTGVASSTNVASSCRALGVSMGAGAICNLLGSQPDLFAKVVLVLPAVIDRPRTGPAIERMDTLAALIEDRDVDGVFEHLLAEQPAPAAARDDVRAWVRQQAVRIVGTPVARAYRELPSQFPVADRSALSRVRVPVLVIGQRGDDAHPAYIAEELGEVFADASVKVFDEGGLLWEHRAELRGLIREFLA